MKRKKNALLVTALLSAALVLGGCGDKEVLKNPPTAEEVQIEFGFRSFDLEIDTVDQKDAVEASFDIEADEVEANYHNKLTKTKLSGDEAYNELAPIFKELALTPSMTREEVIEKVSKAFGVTDYKSFELDIDFMDGSELDFSDIK